MLPSFTALGFYFGGIGMYTGLFFLFLFIPTLDELFGHETANPSKDEEKARAQNVLFDLWVWLWVPFQLAFIGWGLYLTSTASLTTFELVGLILSTGVVTGGIGITAAHELVHRTRAFEQALAEVLMTSVTYTHFCVEHVYGHHKNVATPNDPATSRLGESLYGFIPRTVWGSFWSFWKLEGARCERQNIAWWSLCNCRLRYGLVLAVVYTAIALTLPPLALLYFACQSVIGFLMLEIINYVEHYGLQRKEIEPGRYERVMPKHSWNSTHRLTSWFLFNLPRHADHHYLASRPYYNLMHVEDSPQLPAGYAAMVTLALFPPLWHRVMDHHVENWNQLSAEREQAEQQLRAAA